MDAEELQSRTKQLGIRIIRLVDSLPRTTTAEVVGNQLLRAGTSTGANYRAACRAKSKKDFIYKLRIAIEEADESLYWLELLIEAEIISESRLTNLTAEISEIIAILTASANTARRNIQNSKGSP
jgi:four helix bundle protein